MKTMEAVWELDAQGPRFVLNDVKAGLNLLFMDVPKHVASLVAIVWDICDPEKAVQSKYYNPSMGLPPKELRIYQASSADWDKAQCSRTYIDSWKFDGAIITKTDEVIGSLANDLKQNGMYWNIGTIMFWIDIQSKRAVYSYTLGPRYGRGFKCIFEDVDTLRLNCENKCAVWIS